ncbi:MAG TPA: hypothetical protein VFX70_15195 [Mycobacteriales bacterium]|nr:hypothetical protein [Mycobacteriales bacterium]
MSSEELYAALDRIDAVYAHRAGHGRAASTDSPAARRHPRPSPESK